MATNPGETTIYLDVCCLNRPFDDQTQPRIRLESEAILLILDRVEAGGWNWVGSDVLRFEVEQTPDPERRLRVSTLMESIGTIIELGPSVVSRAKQWESLGFQSTDALHLASAESASVDVFLTTDDRMLRVANRIGDLLRIRVANPLSWLSEVAGS